MMQVILSNSKHPEYGQATIPFPLAQDQYRWNQEVPPGSPKALVRAAKEFSALKIGFRGDLAFKDVEVIDVPRFLCGEIVCRPEYAAFKNEEPSAPEMKMKL